MKKLILFTLLLPTLTYGQNLTVNKASSVTRTLLSSTIIDTVMTSYGAPANLDYARYNSTLKKWQPRTPAQVLSDIGAQASGNYVTIAGTQTISGYKTFTPGATFDGAVLYKSLATNLFAGSGYGILYNYNGGLRYDNGDGNPIIMSSSNTAARTYTFPDASGTIALTSGALSQFASTTSSQLAGVISDETGSGSLVFATSPTLVTPNLGTPSTLVGTNITGTASALNIGGNAATATLAANSTLWGGAAYGGPYLPLTAGSGSPLSGNLYATTTFTVQSGELTQVLNSSTGSMYTQYKGNGTLKGSIGTGDELFTGGATSDFAISSEAALKFGVGNSAKYTIDASGNNTWTGSGTFGGAITSTVGSGIFLSNAAGGTNAVQMRLNNTGGDLRVGVESSTGGSIQDGTSAYASVFGNQSNNPTEFTTNGTSRYSISGSGNHDFKSGTATFGGALTGTTTALSGSASILNNTYSGTNGSWINLQNAGGLLYVGRNNSAGNDFPASAYANIIWGTGARSIEFGTNNTLALTIASDQAITATSLAGTGSRAVVADASGVLSASSATTLSSGTYTPTATLGTNADSATPELAHWMRIGNEVTVYGGMEVDPTATGNTVVFLSLPIASNMTSYQDLDGHGSTSGAGTAATLFISGNDTTDLATTSFISPITGQSSVRYSFMYTVK